MYDIDSVMLAACGSAPSDGNTTRSQTAAAAKATEALPAELSEQATQAAETKAGSGNWLEGARLSSHCSTPTPAGSPIITPIKVSHLCDALVMCDDHNGLSVIFRHTQKQLEHHHAGFGIERAGRLVTK